nr:hypothetical protein Cry52Nrm2_p094 [Cryptomonas curvata]
MKNYENKIKRRASFEINLGQNVLNYIYNIKFKFNYLKFKILSVNEKLKNKIIFGKFFFAKFTLFLFKKNNLGYKKILHFLCSNKLNIAPFNNFFFSFNLLLKTKFIHLVNFNNYYLKNEETKKKKNFKQKNEMFLKINSVKIQISTIKNYICFYQVNYNVKFSYLLIPNFYYFVNSIYSKNSLCKILFMKKLILDKINQINPEYFQVIISCSTVKKILKLIDIQCLFWVNFMFFIIKEIYLLILNEYYWLKKKKQRKVFLLSFFIFIVYNSNLLEFVFKKITINTKNSYFFYQNLEIFFEIIKYIKHFSILINFILRDILKNYNHTYFGFNLKYYFYIVIDSIFGKKLIFLIFYFSEKISRHLNNEIFVKFNHLDKFFYKFFRLFAIRKFNQNSVAINKLVVLLFELVFKNNCIYLNLFFVNQVYKLFIKKQTNRRRKKKDKNYSLLNLKMCELICSLDEYKLPLHFNKFLYNILLKKIFFLEYLKNLKRKLTLPILVKSIELFNFKIFKLLKFEISLLRTNINFHCFKINDIGKKKMFLEKEIMQTLNFIFIIYIINIITQNYKRNFFFRFSLNRKSFDFCKKNHYLKILEYLCIRLILISIEKENNCSIIFFILMKLKFVPLKLLINFYEKKYFLYFIFIYNFSKNFSCNKNEISWIEILRGKLYSIMIKKELCIKFLKKRKNLNLKSNFYSIFAFFYCFINFYFSQKNKIKFYLISTTYFFRVFILVLLGNINNFLPQFSTDYILVRIQKKILQKLDCFINLNIKWALLNKKIKRKWNYYIKHFEKTYILFFKIFYFKNNLLIRSFSFSTWQSNFINLINTYNQHYKNLIFKKYLNKIKEISIFKSKYIVFLLHVFIIDQFELDKSIIDHILSDRKSNFVSSKLKKLGLKIKTNLSTIKKASPFTFFNSIQTRIFSTS